MAKEIIKPEKRSWMMWALIVSAIAAFLYLHGAHYTESKGYHDIGPRFGDFTIDIATNWYAVKNEDDSTLPYFHPLTKGVCWDLRIDMDDSKVFPFPPID